MLFALGFVSGVAFTLFALMALLYWLDVQEQRYVMRD